MTQLSVNINKIATIRNARGGNIPNVLDAAVNCERYGADGITVHPRPDERHIRYQDVYDIKDNIHVEFNIEGNPSDSFMKLVSRIKPAQVTLVPDAHDAITSNSGWQVKESLSYLKDIVAQLKENDIRTSLFVETDLDNIEEAAKTGTDRIELYTEPYARLYPNNTEKAIAPFVKAAEKALEVGLGLNSGHDLNLDNLKFYCEKIPGLLEVSIGHALISDALYYGLENTIQMYKRLVEAE